jgi:hypothetical protein
MQHNPFQFQELIFFTYLIIIFREKYSYFIYLSISFVQLQFPTLFIICSIC